MKNILVEGIQIKKLKIKKSTLGQVLAVVFGIGPLFLGVLIMSPTGIWDILLGTATGLLIGGFFGLALWIAGLIDSND